MNILDRMLIEFRRMSKLPIAFFKSGASITLLALSGIYLLCEEEVARGGGNVHH